MNKLFQATTAGRHLSTKETDVHLAGEIIELSRAKEDAVWLMQC